MRYQILKIKKDLKNKQKLQDALAHCTYENKNEIKERFQKGKRLTPQTNMNKFLKEKNDTN